MKRFSHLALVIVSVLLLPVFARGAEFPKAEGYVTDTVGVMEEGAKEKLEALAGTLHEKTTAQVAVAVVETTGEMPIEEYATELFSRWGVGEKGKDNGALLVVAVKDRKMRIEVGYGLEGAIPDAAAGEIIDSVIKPKFKDGDLSGGIVAGVEAIAARAAGEYGLKPEDVGLTAEAVGGEATKATPLGIAVVVVFSLLFILLIVFVFWKLSQMSDEDDGESDDEDGTQRSRESSDDDDDDSDDDVFGGGSSGGGGASGGW